MRLIDADALINRLDVVDYGMKLPKAVVGLMKALLEDAPTIDIDRPQGEWIIEIDVNGNTYGRCSICGMRQYAGQLNYCPNCGAQMKGADDE